MGIMSLFRGRDAPTNRTAGSSYSFFMGGSAAGKNVNERSAMQMTAVYACVRILSEAIAGLPLHMYQYLEDGSKKKATEHPLYHLLHDEPNPEMTSFVFRETLMTHLLLWGNGYCQIIRNGKGEVVALYPLMPNRMTVDRDAKGRLYYQYQKSSEDAPTMEGSNVILDPSDVLHIPGLGFDGLVGYSPIAMASENITRDIINAREKKWKVVLPESFKIFMLDNNGVIPDERITIETGIALEKFLCIVPAIAESPNATDDIDVVITKYDEFMVFDEDSVGPDLIPFARLSGDKLLCLCYENKNPQIAVWSFEGSEDFSPNYKKVYSSFDEFLSANNIK
jgi:hypothetical protein|nr:phage portal protein [Phocaeicola sartorii]